MKFKDKVVVVTGGGTGIGRGMCLRFARALAPEIRVNAIAPGFVDTKFVNWTPEAIEQLKAQTHLGRPIIPENIADAAVFLACDSMATTGQTILVDGGVTALGPHN
jgi:NAD(P)-dependent dehydrogenase (short-subunit alcohol dehydrogenase family)